MNIMEYKTDGKVSSNGCFSHGVDSSMGETVANIQNLKDTEISTVSSDRVYSAEQTSMRSGFCAEAGQCVNGKRKGVGSFVSDGNKMIKTDSSSSKESSEVVQLSSVDSTDPLLCQSPKEIFCEKKPVLTPLDELNDQETSIVTKVESANVESSRHLQFDLNEGMEAKGAISVVAKVGVPMGLPKKPLQFGGELGWRRAGSASAFRPAASKIPKIEQESYTFRGIDLNVAATGDSELPSDESPTDYDTSKPPGRYILDLNSCSENDGNRCKSDLSSFDLNDNLDNTRNNNFHQREHHLTRNVAADSYTRTIAGLNNASQSFVNTRRPPSYFVDLSSMRSIGVVQPQPFLVATTPTAEQVQMVVPSGVYIGKINNSPLAFYPHSVLPHLNSHHGAAPIPQIPGSGLAPYPGPVHFVEHQGGNPHAHANMRPSFFPNGCIPVMENGNRGVVNPEVFVPVRNVLFETREKAVEQATLPASQINYRQLASWNLV